MYNACLDSYLMPMHSMWCFAVFIKLTEAISALQIVVV